MGTQCGKSAAGITAQYEDCHASASKASPHPISSSELGAPELRVSLEFPRAKLLCSIQVSDAQAAGARTGNLRACFFKRLTALCFWSPPHPTFCCLCLFCFGLHHSPFWIIVPPTRNWTWAQAVKHWVLNAGRQGNSHTWLLTGAAFHALGFPRFCNGHQVVSYGAFPLNSLCH